VDCRTGVRGAGGPAMPLSSGSSPTWWPVGDPQGEVTRGFRGPGPMHLRMPATLSDGRYRLCVPWVEEHNQTAGVIDGCAEVAVATSP